MDEAQRASMARIITRKLLEERCGVPPTVYDDDRYTERDRTIPWGSPGDYNVG